MSAKGPTAVPPPHTRRQAQDENGEEAELEVAPTDLMAVAAAVLVVVADWQTGHADPFLNNVIALSIACELLEAISLESYVTAVAVRCRTSAGHRRARGTPIQRGMPGDQRMDCLQCEGGGSPEPRVRQARARAEVAPELLLRLLGLLYHTEGRSGGGGGKVLLNNSVLGAGGGGLTPPPLGPGVYGAKT